MGTLMVMWCLSGVVMMYVSYPGLGTHSRLDALAPMDWNGCCTIAAAALGDADPVSEIQVEMLAGRPTLAVGIQEHSRLIDLQTGLAIPRVSLGQAADVAQRYGGRDSRIRARLLGAIDYDQWTVAGDFDADRPLYHFALDDSVRTEIYVSSSTGRAVQKTTARERFWNWLGAVPHWLYFAKLRHNPHLWSQVVIAAALLGCLLAITGIYIGVTQAMRGPAGRWSPYAGLNRWHHLAGLIFGVLAFTWVFSGLLSMNPWGWLDAAGWRMEVARLRVRNPAGGEIKAALQNISQAHPAAIASLSIEPLGGRLYFIAANTAGERRRLDAAGAPAPLSEAELIFLADALGVATPHGAAQLMSNEDAYYFTPHNDKAPLPVYRVMVSSEPARGYYLDPVSGALVMKVDRSARAYRWLHEGLHRMDFLPSLRGRPQWDVLMLLLMCGVTALCGTGAYLGYRRLLRF